MKMFATRTWANFISHRPKGDISQFSQENYFTFTRGEYFTENIGCRSKRKSTPLLYLFTDPPFDVTPIDEGKKRRAKKEFFHSRR